MLTEEIVREWRARWASGEMQKTLCAEFGVSASQMSRVINGTRWAVLPGDVVCPECGKGGIEPSGRNGRILHIACAAARKSRHPWRENNPSALARERAQEQAARAIRRAERYATDAVYRAGADVRRLHSLAGRPYLEALSWRVLWTRYRLREVDFLRLLAWQDEACPCGKPFGEKPHVDHDHRCCPSVVVAKSCGNCVRGLLHPRCNHLLGIIENNLDVIRPAGWVEKYLTQPPYWQMLAHQGPMVHAKDNEHNEHNEPTSADGKH